MPPGSIKNELIGKTTAERAAIKAQRLAERVTAARLPYSFTQEGYLITVYSVGYTGTMWQADVSASIGERSYRDTLQVNNIPIMVPTGETTTDPETGDTVAVFEENPIAAVKSVLVDVARVWLP